jgi:16S rRNA (guanine527-N7)-methyltransferase
VERSPGVSRGTLERLNRLERRHELPAGAVDALARLLAHQAADEHAPTTVRDPAVAADRHVADSLIALDVPAVRAARTIADLGAGAGWPGLALAAALPDARVRLVESGIRRCSYLERAIEAAGLDNAEVVHARAEDWPAGIGAHDLVTARALAAMPVVCEYAAPLLGSGGTLAAWKGRLDDAEARAGAAAAGELGLSTPEALTVDPYPGAGPATLVLARKIAPTPDRFPRRPGMALKRPLGAGS